MTTRKAYVIFSLVSLLLCAASVLVFIGLNLAGLWLGVIFIVSFLLFCLAWVAGLAAFKSKPDTYVEGSLWQVLVELLFDLP